MNYEFPFKKQANSKKQKQTFSRKTAVTCKNAKTITNEMGKYY